MFYRLADERIAEFMTEFTPLASLIGGVMISLSAVLLMLWEGRIAGISGIASRHDDWPHVGQSSSPLGRYFFWASATVPIGWQSVMQRSALVSGRSSTMKASRLCIFSSVSVLALTLASASTKPLR